MSSVFQIAMKDMGEMIELAKINQPIIDGINAKLADIAYNVKNFGAKGDGVNDDYAAFLAARDACLANGGGTIYFPAGTFYMGPGLVIDNSDSEHFIDPSKIHIEGAGIGQTTIKYTGSGAALTLIGGKTGAANSFMTYQTIRGIRFLGGYVKDSKGVYVDTCSFLHFKECSFQGFDMGFHAQDMDNTSFTKCIIHWNNYGIKLQEREPRNPLTSTRPNNINFYDCQIGGNLNWGGLFIGGSCINFFGGDIQGNGVSGTDATKWGVQFLDPGVQGGVACNFYGVFFESNVGVADLWLYTQKPSAYGPTPAAYNVHGCTFNQSLDIYNSTYNILVGFDSAKFGQQKLVVTGCGFKNFNDVYTPTGVPHIVFVLDPRDNNNSYIAHNVQSDDNEAVVQDKSLPLSTTTVGAIGEYKQIQGAVGAALSLPAGGMWEWSGFYVLNSSGMMTYIGANLAGVAAGGTQVLSGVANHMATATIRRIA